MNNTLLHDEYELISCCKNYSEYRHKTTEVEFVFIQGGKFSMGSSVLDRNHQDDEKLHTVYLSPFLIAKYTIGEIVYKTNKEPEDPGRDIPKVDVSWEEAVNFSAQHGWQLPSESQWEYACRANLLSENNSAYHTGEELLKSDANWRGSREKDGINIRAYYSPNSFGLFQMHGNVLEWCNDIYDKNFYSDKIKRQLNPFSFQGSQYRVLRGGGWNDHPIDCRSAARDGLNPAHSFSDVGFRPSKSLLLEI